MKPDVFDAHCDTIARFVQRKDIHFAGNADGQWDLNRLDQLGNVAQIFSFFWDSAKTVYTPVENIARYYAAFQRELAREPRMVQCRTAEEIEAAFAQGKRAAILSVEGGELLGCDLSLLEQAYHLGVRAVNITWNHANALSGSHLEEPERGLSQLGRTFVRRMQHLGMLADVSHLSEKGFWDVIEIAQKPIIASHSNSQNTFFHSRNLTDAQFTAIMKHQGFVGLNGYARFIAEGQVTPEDLLRHLEHFRALGGETTVGLGGDWDGCDLLPEGWQGVWNWGDFCELLLRHNYRESLVRDLFLNNLMRTVRQVCIM